MYSSTFPPEKNITVYVSHGLQCHSISVSSDGESVVVLPVDNLTSDIEEADSRMILHAMHASEQSRDVIIQSDDTDVFLLCVAFGHRLSTRLLLAHSDSTLYDINEVHKKFGTDFCEALLGLHAFTGNDTISCFAGKGKIKPLTLMQSSAEYMDAFGELGRTWEVSEDMFDTLESFVCQLYGYCTQSVGEARFQHFKKTYKLDKNLPPDQDSLRQHTRRSCYQAGIWRRATTSFTEVPNPLAHGWQRVDYYLCPMWTTKPCIPDSLLVVYSLWLSNEQM